MTSRRWQPDMAGQFDNPLDGRGAMPAPSAPASGHCVVSLHPLDRALLARAFTFLIARGMGIPSSGDSQALLEEIEDLIVNGWPAPVAGAPGSPEGSEQ